MKQASKERTRGELRVRPRVDPRVARLACEAEPLPANTLIVGARVMRRGVQLVFAFAVRW